MQFDTTILTDAFIGLPFTVRGVGFFKLENGIPIVAKRVDNRYERIGLDDGDNSGYLRASGDATFTPGEMLSCTTQYYTVKDEINLVVGTTKYDMDSLVESLKYRIAIIPGTKIKRIVEDRDKIITEEKMTENQLNLIKIVFDYEYDYIAPTEDCIDVLCDC